MVGRRYIEIQTVTVMYRNEVTQKDSREETEEKRE